MIDKEQFLRLLKIYNQGKATDEEIALLNAYYDLFNVEPEVIKLMELSKRLALKREMESHIFDKINQEKEAKTRSFRFPWWQVAAASVILILSFGLYFTQQTKVPKLAEQVYDVQPGMDKAILTLADGSKIKLDDAKKGMLANQGATKVNKTTDGTVVYNTSKNNLTNEEISFNTLETPAGGKFQIVLPDGSKVWLNAKSSIRYPVEFPAQERRVEITGEVYFEIEKDRRKPFRVIADNQITEVLGTHFNVNSYGDEGLIKTTLLEGAVKVSTTNSNKVALLTPGQQSQQHVGSDLKVLRNVDVEEASAWKNGFFQFSGTDLKNIMRQLSRWYDVDIDISRLPDKEFNGVISRGVPLSKVLRMLELTSKLKFKIVEANDKAERRKIMLK